MSQIPQLCALMWHGMRSTPQGRFLSWVQNLLWMVSAMKKEFDLSMVLYYMHECYMYVLQCNMFSLFFITNAVLFCWHCRKMWTVLWWVHWETASGRQHSSSKFQHHPGVVYCYSTSCWPWKDVPRSSTATHKQQHRATHCLLTVVITEHSWCNYEICYLIKAVSKVYCACRSKNWGTLRIEFWVVGFVYPCQLIFWILLFIVLNVMTLIVIDIRCWHMAWGVLKESFFFKGVFRDLFLIMLSTCFTFPPLTI